jgi:RimJ/RimL family protein N-acetyltransferase
MSPRIVGADRRGRSVHLEQLQGSHAAAILAGQDRALAREVFGCRWEPEGLAEFLARTERWRPDGPLREYAARPADGGPDGGQGGAIVGGGGLHLLGPGLEQRQADMTYWVLAPHRGHGWGTAIAQALCGAASSDPRIATLVLRISPENTASQRVARAVGASPTGHSERHPGDASRRVERWELDLGGRIDPPAQDPGR